MNAIVLYRIGRWFSRRGVPVLPNLIYWLTFIIFNSSIPPSCDIGRGSRFGYGAIGVVLHSRCRIGSGVLIGQNVTIGGSFGSNVPQIGNNVWISPGARVIGGVRVGNNVIIGANAVVVRDVPGDCIVAGVPARILRRIPEGSLDALGGTLATDSTSQESVMVPTLGSGH